MQLRYRGNYYTSESTVSHSSPDFSCIQYRGSKQSPSIHLQAMSIPAPKPLVYRGIAYTESH